MTSRQRGVLQFLAGFVGVTVLCTGLVTAQNSGSGPGVLRTSADSSSNSSSDDDDTAAYFARGYASTMAEDEQRLTIMTNSLLTESVCDGEPMVILKSATVPTNGACLTAQSRYNLSCACLSGYTNTTAWSFRIGVPNIKQTSPFPTTISQGNVLQVNALMMLDIPPNLRIFKIQGESSNVVPVNLEKSASGDDVLAIVRSQEVSALTKVDILNLDLSEVPIGDGFVPSTLSSLLMRRCNLSSLSQSFLESFTALASLNVAANKLSSIYTSLPGSAEALNAMTDINLANNSFTEFPSQLLQFPNLRNLDLSGNNITNLTVTSDELAAISQLSVFQIDTPATFVGNGSGCDSGEWQKVHNTNFCVLNSTSNASSATVASEGSGDDTTNWAIFMLVTGFGGCLMGFLLFFLATKFVQHQQERKKRSTSPGAEDVQTSRAVDITVTQEFYNSLHPTLNADLLNDPLIMSFRLKYKDLHIGRCISKGGFGLVYTGMYKHRRVAIKKIMREKCEKLSQIRMFIPQDNPDERRSQEQKILEKVALGSLRPTFYNDCPPGVLALAASCLEGRPENRPSASEVVLTIKELMREMQFDNNRPQSEPEPDIATAGFLSST
ncbi:hypothetical protein PF004_g3584 [Phytophthora fragariae]|uniref:Protein kinase domain-containing protein n=1 Tax=Phytophthora fragariae TaxID=53985 RepID=A0A6G0PLG3_9STRA|nr:hypothetical protein PF004_g3584 [Phytophthora fragariae]